MLVSHSLPHNPQFNQHNSITGGRVIDEGDRAFGIRRRYCCGGFGEDYSRSKRDG